MTTAGTWSHRFEVALAAWAADSSLGDDRFLARNFILDDRVTDQRRITYETFMADLSEFSRWRHQHDVYLTAHIRRTDLGGGTPADPLRPADAADTFDVTPLLSPYADAAHDLELVRVVTLRHVARLANVRVDELIAASADPSAFQALLDDASEALDATPWFAGFWEDVARAVADPAEVPLPRWPDTLRDRFGLFHLDPPPGAQIPVILLRYPVGETTRLEGLRNRRALVVPTVVDCGLFAAFCPAPNSSPIGSLVNLTPTADIEPAGELLHPPMSVRAAHVYLIGNVERAAPPLAVARAFHLVWLQQLTGTNYGESTDSDLVK